MPALPPVAACSCGVRRIGAQLSGSKGIEAFHVRYPALRLRLSQVPRSATAACMRNEMRGSEQQQAAAGRQQQDSAAVAAPARRTPAAAARRGRGLAAAGRYEVSEVCAYDCRPWNLIVAAQGPLPAG
eukprot:COSAG01_NODE_1045_length_11952_cov_98.448241_2_plen_128_part_00